MHVVDTFASSKMSADKLNMCENVCVACGKKKKILPLKRFPSPPPTSLKDHTMSPPIPLFFGGSFICRAVASAATCKQVARTGCSRSSSSSSRLLCTKPGRRRCRKLQIRSHYTATNMTGPSAAHYSSSETHSLSVSSNEREQCEASAHCAAEQEAAFP